MTNTHTLAILAALNNDAGYKMYESKYKERSPKVWKWANEYRNDDSSPIECAIQLMESHPRLTFIVASASIVFGLFRYYNPSQSKRRVDIMKSPTETFVTKTFTGIYSSFFNTNTNKPETPLNVALKRFNSLVTTHDEENDDFLEAINQKQQDDTTLDISPFIQELLREMLTYPTCPKDVACVTEVEQAIDARIAHHAKIKLSVENYLSSLPQDENFRQPYNTTLEN